MSTQYNIDYAVVKKPSDDAPLTQEESNEWLKCALDPFYFFITYCYVVGPTGKTLYQPRDYQKEMIDDVLSNRHTVVNAPRQIGKSVSMALLALHTSIFQPDKTVGISSYRLSGCKDLMQRVKYTYEALPNFLKPPVVLYNQSEIRFTNGSIIFTQVTSEQVFRGRSINGLAILDEYAHLPPAVADAAFESFMPALEAGGAESTAKVVFISTPAGSSGKYAEIVFGAVAGTNGFVYHKVDHSRIVGRDEKFKEEQIRRIGITKWLQEFEGHFLSDKGTLISSMKLESLTPTPPVRSIGHLDIFVDSFSGRNLIIGADIAEGIGQDSSTFQVFDVDTLEQVAEFSNNVLNQSQFTKELIKSIRYFNECGVGEIYLGVEANGIGAGVLRLLENSGDDSLMSCIMIGDVDAHGMSIRSGLTTTNRSKMEGCGQFKDLVESDRMKLNSSKLLNELRFFVKQGNTFKAERGAHDDLCMSCIIVCNMLKQISNYEDTIEKVINELEGINEHDEVWDIMF